MTTFLELFKIRIQPTKKNFYWYIFILLLSNLFFHLLYFYVFISTIFWKIKFIPKTVKIIAISLFTVLILVFNLVQLLTYLDLSLPAGNDKSLLIIINTLENMHFIMFALFFYGIFNIIFIKNSPFSLISVGLYNFVHAVFNKCPMISLQNFFIPGSGDPLYQNEFWQNYFGTYTDIMRYAIAGLSFLMFYAAYLQLKNLKYSFGFFEPYFIWKDYQFNYNNKNTTKTA